ncbi:3',5'-cyclic-nucleotide phosphodiesterase [Nguyenibacter vanlangensis]|uniref:3',5'-cyclic-nucleotide phosphodiesterase n=1 Tax=Nguyenibacter vanlangensis TaxID=1216886 RepID=A0ABZ3D7I2_9PROT
MTLWGITRPACATGFDIVVLGARGGIQDGNLSAYLVRPSGDARAILCDAGTVVAGLEAASRHGAFHDLTRSPQIAPREAGIVLHDIIKGYLISHAHLDHIAGLVAVSPDDMPKPIYALPSVNRILARDIFNWRVWPNMGDRGPPPRLATYRYRDLVPGQRLPLDGTAMEVRAFPLSHGGVESTAFLIESGGAAMVYLGDTGPDALEHGTRLQDLWRAVAPLARAHRLKGIIIECSWDNARPDHLLFGHLTPRWLAATLSDLRSQSGGGTVLAGLPVLVSHVKYTLTGAPPAQVTIENELKAADRTGVHFIIAEQGMSLRFD